jgi:hypothetical protein
MAGLFDIEGNGIDPLDPRWQTYIDGREEPHVAVFYQPQLGGIYLIAQIEDFTIVDGTFSITENAQVYLMGAIDPNAGPLSDRALYHFDNAGKILGWDKGTVQGAGDYVQRPAIDERLAVGFELIARGTTNLAQSVRRNLATLKQPGSEHRPTKGSSLNHRL